MSKCEALVATPQLRWQQQGYSRYMLQQYWTDPLGVSGKGEWREVPFVNVQPNSWSPKESPVVHCDGD
jgi:hypothetical protein